MAERRVFDPLIGRESELERVVQVISRRRKNNPVLLGEPGVGKTAIVEGLATRIVDGEVPPSLLNKRILALDLSLVVAGTKYRGQFEERHQGGSWTEMTQGRTNVILFIDELHTIDRSRFCRGSDGCFQHHQADAAQRVPNCNAWVPPPLNEYRKLYREGLRASVRRFQQVKVRPNPPWMTPFEILKRPARRNTKALPQGVQASAKSCHPRLPSTLTEPLPHRHATCPTRPSTCSMKPAPVRQASARLTPYRPRSRKVEARACGGRSTR